MKKFLLSILAAFQLFALRADEGMWIPSLIGKNYDEMVRMGLKLSPEDLYSINQASIKDAIVQFGRVCTGEMISPQGLLITNHHCGYGNIASLSSVENNYLDDGFWAYSREEELPAKGLSVIFLQQIVDVTDEVESALKRKKGKKREEALNKITEELETRAEEGGKYEASLKSYFSGNQFLLLTYKRYTDVRLVGTPPKSLGKFGGDTDNWMWPRHTCDFALFRVYAGKDNEPAEFSEDNVPYRPKKYLPISIKGIEEGDFAMIFGYPGRTNRYEISAGVAQAIEEVNPSIVKLREKRLAIMREHMDKDKAIYLKLTTSYSQIANYWKYFIGQTEQLKRLKVVDEKKRNEQAFVQWAREEAPRYKKLIEEYKAAYQRRQPYAKHQIYFREGFYASYLNRLGASLAPMKEELSRNRPNADTLEKHKKALKRNFQTMLRTVDLPTDQDIFAAMTRLYYEDLPASQLPMIYQQVIFRQFGPAQEEKTYADYARHVYSNSFLTDSNRLNRFLENPSLEALNSDPAVVHALSFVENYKDNLEEHLDRSSEELAELKKTYLAGLMEMNKGKLMYPDANSTMRVAYGQVLSYEPQDAVHYDYYTTLEGFMEKYKPGDPEFDAPQELIDLYEAGDYGIYANEKGELVTCFISTNDITGGNSGSAIINGRGEFIGIAFDGNWEAMSGDIAFDKKYKRTISTDARFIMFVIDKIGKAHNLIEEMEIRK